jgi:hypothetical protein
MHYSVHSSAVPEPCMASQRIADYRYRTETHGDGSQQRWQQYTGYGAPATHVRYVEGECE